jgi:putative tricarboxylic transport membrane protein
VVLAVVLAQLMETSLRQSLMLSEGSLSIFVQRPLSAVLALLVIASLVLPIFNALMSRRAARRAQPDALISNSSD